MMETGIKKIHCPGCRQETSWQGNSYRPFCSKACQQVDLGRWATEEYSLVGDPVPDESERSDF